MINRIIICIINLSSCISAFFSAYDYFIFIIDAFACLSNTSDGRFCHPCAFNCLYLISDNNFIYLFTYQIIIVETLLAVNQDTNPDSEC